MLSDRIRKVKYQVLQCYELILTPRYDRNPSFPVHFDCQGASEPYMRDKLSLPDDFLAFQDIPVQGGVFTVMLHREITDIHRCDIMEKV